MNRNDFINAMNSGISLTNRERLDILNLSVCSHPMKVKCVIIMEELAELEQQISKHIRGCGDMYALVEEMADVTICLCFLAKLFDIDDDFFQKAIDVKLEREMKRLEEDDKND